MLRVSLLGEQVVTDTTGPVVSRSSRTLALIGYLAIHAGTPQSRQRIAGLFWPESTDAQALTNLRRELHHLRLLVGDESLVVTSRDLCWRDSVSCMVDVRVLLTSRERTAGEAGEEGVIIGGPVLYDIADTAEVMRWYRELLPSLPEELSGWIALLTIPPAPPFPQELWGRRACGIVWCYTGAHASADEVLAPVREFGSPLLVGMHPMPFNVLQGAFDGLYPAGLQWYWRADFFDEISDEAIDVHLKYGALLPTGHSTMHLYPIGGAAGRVPEERPRSPTAAAGGPG